MHFHSHHVVSFLFDDANNLFQAAHNLNSYGHHPDIVFVQPEDHYQGLICQKAQGSGAVSSVCRVMVRYNIDQFLQRPILHQWLQNGKIYREAGERQSSRFELFFDLLFVGIVHQIAEAAAEEPTGIGRCLTHIIRRHALTISNYQGFAKYVLTFAPAFSIWGDVRDIANQFANDDVTQRAYILWIMVLLVGYSNNASAIEWGMPEGIDGVENPYGESISAESTLAIRWTLGFYVVAKLSKGLF